MWYIFDNCQERVQEPFVKPSQNGIFVTFSMQKPTLPQFKVRPHNYHRYRGRSTTCFAIVTFEAVGSSPAATKEEKYLTKRDRFFIPIVFRALVRDEDEALSSLVCRCFDGHCLLKTFSVKSQDEAVLHLKLRII